MPLTSVFSSDTFRQDSPASSDRSLASDQGVVGGIDISVGLAHFGQIEVGIGVKVLNDSV